MSAETTLQEQGKNFKLWLQELKSPEAKSKAIQKFYQEFEPNVKKAIKDLNRNYNFEQSDIYQQGVCLLLELVFSGKLETVEVERIPGYINHHIKHRLLDYLNKFQIKHEKQGTVKAVEEEQEQGKLNPLVDITKDVRPDEKLLEKEYTLRIQKLKQKIVSKLPTLTPRKQQIIRRHYLEHASMQEISQELNCSPTNSYKLRNGALEDLRKTIVPHLKEDADDQAKPRWLN